MPHGFTNQIISLRAIKKYKQAKGPPIAWIHPNMFLYKFRADLGYRRARKT